MTQPKDGGEAILEAFRNLGIDYITSSPGSEWAPVWDALARQKVNATDGPTYINCWHETLAVDMALGYTRVTGNMQAVLLHAGVGLLQGSVGIHSAYQGEVPVLICSGEATSYGENPALDPQGQWYRNLSVVGGPNTFVAPFVKWSGQATSPYTLYEQLVRAGEMAQRVPKGPTFLDVPIETMIHDWTPPAKLRKIASAPKTQPAAESITQLVELIANSNRPMIITESAGKEHLFYHRTEVRRQKNKSSSRTAEKMLFVWSSPQCLASSSDLVVVRDVAGLRDEGDMIARGEDDAIAASGSRRSLPARRRERRKNRV